MFGRPIVHLELSANDPQAAGAFYREIFGWTIEHDATFDYMQFQTGNGPGGAFPKVDGQHTKAGDIVPYIGSSDIDNDLARVTELGGSVVLPKMEVPGIGWIAIFRDPTGNNVGLFASIHG